MRTSTRIGVAVTMTLAGAIVPAASARGQLLRPEGPAEQVGQVVGGALDSAGRAVERGLRTAFTKTRRAVESMEVTARVYSRLHWDKELAGSRLYLESRPGGVVLLRGNVSSKEAADRAVSLAASTIGVSRVVSELVAPESSATVVPNPLTSPEIRSPLSDPVLEPLPRSEPEPVLEPLPRPLSDPEPEPDPEPEVESEPAPSIRPPLPSP